MKALFSSVLAVSYCAATVGVSAAEGPPPLEDSPPTAAVAPTTDIGAIGPDAPPTLRKIFSQRFTSSRLFAMPIADVVGAFQVTFSGDGSLLQQPGLLTSAGVVAVGFGDIAQIEYRNSSAVGATGVEAPIPAVGVQLKVPLPTSRHWPALAVAFRLGVNRRESIDNAELDESVTDLYIVSRLHLWGPLQNFTLHAGTRISSAKAAAVGDMFDSTEQQRTMVLPAGGWEVRMNPLARLVGEISLAPQFRWEPALGGVPTIDYGLLGRLGLRWQVIPAFTFDGSIGYQVEVGRMSDADSLRSLVQWDIRLGAEIFIPWGALVCRGV
ncbi:MAG: hypothetical protein KBG15_22980, partial [Kofleriaceae bacterium]|nr:hypothetical protein [Kofleriaceae bacterium]